MPFWSRTSKEESDERADDRSSRMPAARNNPELQEEYRKAEWTQTRLNEYADACGDDSLKNLANGQVQNAIQGASFNREKLCESLEQGNQKEAKIDRHFTEKPLEAADRMLKDAKDTASKNVKR